jgi:Cys-rich repeat protein
MRRDTGFPTWRLVAGVVVTSCLLLSFVWAADQGTGAVGYSYQKQVIARVGAVQGDTKVQRAGEAQFKKIAVKAPLYVMDFLATGKNSKLWWHGTFNAFSPSEKWKPGPDVTEGSLAADSVFGFKQFERAGASYRFVGYVQKGTVRFIKTLPNTNPPSTFTLGTHTAWIEVVPSDRAADFIVESKNESLTTVTVLWGKVRVKNISPQIKESRVLTSCQEVDVERDQEPGEIKWVSTDTMKELVKRTTIPKTLPEDVPSCERLKTEVILDLTEVYLPPPGVALFPVVPVPVPGDKPECCPPGKTYNPRTGQCVCPCPEGERPPVTALGNNGSFIDPGPCGSCRRGATFNQQTCACECPCPQGFLLPGQGCVAQCPEGFSEAYDASNSPPYGCKYCVQYPPGIVGDPIPPPLRQCQDGAQCDRCEACIDGTCVPRVCKTGFYLNRDTCQCELVDGRVPRGCQSDEQCPPCQQCREGQCVSVIVCRPEQRLNLETCKCEPVGSKLCPDIVCGPNQRLNVDTCQCESATHTIPKPEQPEVPEIQESIGTPIPWTPGTPPECQANSDCGSGQICRKGKCVKKPPSRSISKPTPSGEESVELPNLMQESGPGIPSGSFSIGIGGGSGSSGTGSSGTGGTPRGFVAPTQKIAPVQRIRRGGRAN